MTGEECKAKQQLAGGMTVKNKFQFQSMSDNGKVKKEKKNLEMAKRVSNAHLG